MFSFTNEYISMTTPPYPSQAELNKISAAITEYLRVTYITSSTDDPIKRISGLYKLLGIGDITDRTAHLEPDNRDTNQFTADQKSIVDYVIGVVFPKQHSLPAIWEYCCKASCGAHDHFTRPTYNSQGRQNLESIEGYALHILWLFEYWVMILITQILISAEVEQSNVFTQSLCQNCFTHLINRVAIFNKLQLFWAALRRKASLFTKHGTCFQDFCCRDKSNIRDAGCMTLCLLSIIAPPVFGYITSFTSKIFYKTLIGTAPIAPLFFLYRLRGFVLSQRHLYPHLLTSDFSSAQKARFAEQIPESVKHKTRALLTAMWACESTPQQTITRQPSSQLASGAALASTETTPLLQQPPATVEAPAIAPQMPQATEVKCNICRDKKDRKTFVKVCTNNHPDYGDHMCFDCFVAGIEVGHPINDCPICRSPLPTALAQWLANPRRQETCTRPDCSNLIAALTYIQPQ